MLKNKPIDKFIFFFDGDCALCSRTVNYILKRDNSNLFYFSPLQGKTSEKILENKERMNLDTVILFTPDKIKYNKSDAIIKALSMLGGMNKFFVIFKVFPQYFRDSIYDLIAFYRHKIFKKNSFCPIPNNNQRKKFLD